MRIASSTIRADCSCGSTDASTPVNAIRRNGSPITISSTAVAVATGAGRRITERESRYHGPACTCAASRCIATCQRFRLPRVHARAEHREQRRQQRQRHERGAEGHEHAAGAHRVQEAQLEHEHRGERRRHREGGEQHGPAGRADRRAQRLRAIGARRELLAEARDHEQRVVDRQAEPEPGREVDRERRHRLEAVDDPQAREREQHRGHPDRQRQQRGDEAAEHEQREQQQDRRGQHLRALEVGLHLVADLVERHDPAADRHARLAARGAPRARRPPSSSSAAV